MSNTSSFHRTRTNRRLQSGQTLVELCFVLVFWVISLMMILEMIVYMHTFNVLADSAKEGVRYAIVHGANNPQGIASSTTSGAFACSAASCPDLLGPAAPAGTTPGYNSTYGVVKSFAQFSLHDVSAMTVTATYPDGTFKSANQTPGRVQIVVSYTYQPFFFSFLTIPVYAAAEGRIMN